MENMYKTVEIKWVAKIKNFIWMKIKASHPITFIPDTCLKSKIENTQPLEYMLLWNKLDTSLFSIHKDGWK